jgi:hypothetical protein
VGLAAHLAVAMHQGAGDVLGLVTNASTQTTTLDHASSYT